MLEITVERNTVNVEALDAVLRSALGGVMIGVSVGAGEVRVHLDANATVQQVAQAESLILAHDPTQLSPRQQAEIEQRQTLEQFRADNANPIDPSEFDGDSASVQALAAKVAWLEHEIAALIK